MATAIADPQLDRLGRFEAAPVDDLVARTVAGVGSLSHRLLLQHAAEELASHLPVAVQESRPALLFERISWLRPFLSHRGVDDATVHRLLEAFAVAVSRLPSVPPKAIQYAQAAPATLRLPCRTPFPAVGGGGSLGRLSRAFARALRDLDLDEGRRILAGFAQEGASFDDLRSALVEPGLAEMGRLWQLNRLGPGRCQAAASLVRILVEELRPRVPSAPQRQAWAVVAAAPGERHTLGPTLVGWALESDGWRVADLGAARASDVVASAADLGARLVALSATEATALPALRDLAGTLRRQTPEASILVGGRILALHEGLERDVGADAKALSPAEAVTAARRMLDSA